MTRKTQLVCDGCGETELVEQGSLAAKIKEGLAVSLNGGADKTYDLCFACEKHLARQADPKSWPRVADPT